jgi:hypothetical protein
MDVLIIAIQATMTKFERGCLSRRLAVEHVPVHLRLSRSFCCLFLSSTYYHDLPQVRVRQSVILTTVVWLNDDAKT